MMDFELAAINAITSVFPHALVKGCYFHFSKTIYRHIQGTPADVLYKNNDEERILIKSLMALAFVPESVFEELQGCFEKYPDLLPVIMSKL
jgi:hypothetical protein